MGLATIIKPKENEISVNILVDYNQLYTRATFLIMTSGYSGTPLARKLGIKEGFKVLFINHPTHYFDLFEDMPNTQVATEEDNDIDFIHFFTKESDELKVLLPQLKKLLKMKGMIWVSWPKKSSKVETDVSDSVVRSTGLEVGLVDTKVCAVDEVWSGLKFMYRVKDRK